MLAYRIAKCNRVGDMTGSGAKLFGGRWNSVGVPIHYMAATRALAALEVLVNQNNIADFTGFCLTTFELPDDSLAEINEPDLPPNWNRPMIETCRRFGDDFAKDGKSLLLRVPSAVIADEFNYLMNVNHPLVRQVKIIEIKPFEFDKRLL